MFLSFLIIISISKDLDIETFKVPEDSTISLNSHRVIK